MTVRSDAAASSRIRRLAAAPWWAADASTRASTRAGTWAQVTGSWSRSTCQPTSSAALASSLRAVSTVGAPYGRQLVGWAGDGWAVRGSGRARGRCGVLAGVGLGRGQGCGQAQAQPGRVRGQLLGPPRDRWMVWCPQPQQRRGCAGIGSAGAGTAGDLAHGVDRGVHARVGLGGDDGGVTGAGAGAGVGEVAGGVPHPPATVAAVVVAAV